MIISLVSTKSIAFFGGDVGFGIIQLDQNGAPTKSISIQDDFTVTIDVKGFVCSAMAWAHGLLHLTGYVNGEWYIASNIPSLFCFFCS